MTFQSAVSPYKVAILGGAFDPWTLEGHQGICNIVTKETNLDVWVMPCYNHMFGKKPTSPEHRWSMVKLVGSKNTRIIPLNWEINNEHTGSMFEAATALKSEYAIEPHIVIGMDNANRIHEWDRWELLIEQFPFIVIDRGGYIARENWFLKEPHQRIHYNSNVSSSSVRAAISNRDFNLAKQMVPDYIWDYMVQNKLYGL